MDPEGRVMTIAIDAAEYELTTAHLGCDRGPEAN
jgi:hypothetical protein